MHQGVMLMRYDDDPEEYNRKIRRDLLVGVVITLVILISVAIWFAYLTR